MDARQHIINEAIQEQRQIFGMENPDKAWILSDWDTWETNPFYCGPPQPHPEYDTDGDIQEEASSPLSTIPVLDDCPF